MSNSTAGILHLSRFSRRRKDSKQVPSKRTWPSMALRPVAPPPSRISASLMHPHITYTIYYCHIELPTCTVMHLQLPSLLRVTYIFISIISKDFLDVLPLKGYQTMQCLQGAAKSFNEWYIQNALPHGYISPRNAVWRCVGRIGRGSSVHEFRSAADRLQRCKAKDVTAHGRAIFSLTSIRPSQRPPHQTPF